MIIEFKYGAQDQLSRQSGIWGVWSWSVGTATEVIPEYCYLTAVVSNAYDVTVVVASAFSLSVAISHGNAMADIQLGDTVDVTGTFRDRDDALVDPTTVSCTLRDPSDNDTTYVYGTDAELVQVSSGIYRLTVPVDEAGRWYWRMFSTGSQAAETGSFIVEQSAW